MLTDEMTFRALLAASGAERQGFHATAEAFRGLARGFVFDMPESQFTIDLSPSTRGDTMVEPKALAIEGFSDITSPVENNGGATGTPSF